MLLLKTDGQKFNGSSTFYRRVNEANFGWRALRLLARRSLHFFTHGNTPITKLPDYLETHVRKLAKDLQVQETVQLKFLCRGLSSPYLLRG